MVIALHDNGLGLRGTSVALYDYAFYLKELYNIKCIILYNSKHSSNNIEVINKFKKHFRVISYHNIIEIDNILAKEKCDYFFTIKSGQKDGVISKVCKNLVLAVSAHITKKDIHGDKYFTCSKWLYEKTNIDYIPHMINLPNNNDNLRKELNIPNNAIVFGRNGGAETFDINFVKKAILDILDIRDDIYFLFQNTNIFLKHDRVINIPSSPDMDYKVKFINTCDAHLHARTIGESFGLTCGEFSSKNKPIITWDGSPERNHIDILGDKALLYNNYDDIMNIFKSFNKDYYLNINVNCYNDYIPKIVMNKFIEKYEIKL